MTVFMAPQWLLGMKGWMIPISYKPQPWRVLTGRPYAELLRTCQFLLFGKWGGESRDLN